MPSFIDITGTAINEGAIMSLACDAPYPLAVAE